tara:strand:- start:837 stop:1037 length:201 start_codon:yes stop_codon:yes gene_type:complete
MMDNIEDQTEKFIAEIENKINYYVDEFEISPHALLGALEYVKVSYANHLAGEISIIYEPEEEDEDE